MLQGLNAPFSSYCKEMLGLSASGVNLTFGASRLAVGALLASVASLLPYGFRCKSEVWRKSARSRNVARLGQSAKPAEHDDLRRGGPGRGPPLRLSGTVYDLAGRALATVNPMGQRVVQASVGDKVHYVYCVVKVKFGLWTGQGARHGLQLTAQGPTLARGNPFGLLTQLLKGARDGARQKAHSAGRRTAALRRRRRQKPRRERFYGAQGPAWGSRLSEIEAIFLEIREVFTEKMLDLSLAQQATAVDEQPPPPIGAVLAASNRSLAATRTTRASSRRGRAKPSGTNRKVPARAVGGLFPPQSKSLGLDQGEASAALLEKITYAGVVARSFRRV
jgi:hypothetical protein